MAARRRRGEGRRAFLARSATRPPQLGRRVFLRRVNRSRFAHLVLPPNFGQGPKLCQQDWALPLPKWMSASLPRSDGQWSGLLAFARHEGLGAVIEAGVGPRETLLLNGLAQAAQAAGGIFPVFRSLWWEKVHLDRSQAWKSQPCSPGTAWAAWGALGGRIPQRSCLPCSAQGPTRQASDTQAKNFPTVHLPCVALRPASHAWNAPRATATVLKKSLCCTKE